MASRVAAETRGMGNGREKKRGKTTVGHVPPGQGPFRRLRCVSFCALSSALLFSCCSCRCRCSRLLVSAPAAARWPHDRLPSSPPPFRRPANSAASCDVTSRRPSASGVSRLSSCGRPPGPFFALVPSVQITPMARICSGWRPQTARGRAIGCRVIGVTGKLCARFWWARFLRGRPASVGVKRAYLWRATGTRAATQIYGRSGAGGRMEGRRVTWAHHHTRRRARRTAPCAVTRSRAASRL
ncbi:LAFE_0C11782g1_1 [Lachancea fermentati]|uniref:LAFE_0C11782g1_1 n=1 Tax=Lachancea fermentati TaxID=4955 RepID=A0A1G4MAQ0_LACFM|nr:LAFE_0C11782g1_1 [Lachancea fermentati]